MRSQLTTTPDRSMQRIDGPNPSELERAEALADYVAKRVSIARAFHLPDVSLGLAEAEELVQMMMDGVRTAKQLKASGEPPL